MEMMNKISLAAAAIGVGATGYVLGNLFPMGDLGTIATALRAGGTVMINAQVCADKKAPAVVDLTNKGHPSIIIGNTFDLNCAGREF